MNRYHVVCRVGGQRWAVALVLNRVDSADLLMDELRSAITDNPSWRVAEPGIYLVEEGLPPMPGGDRERMDAVLCMLKDCCVELVRESMQ